MQNCKGCREQQTNETLCLVCIEDLRSYLREIPVLYAELEAVRLPGSIRRSGPWTSRPNRIASPSPVRLEVVDMLDRGETMARLLQWTDTGASVLAICDGFRSHILTTASESWAGDFFRAMRALCRDLGRAVGQPEEQSVGKCSVPVDGDELCRGSLYRAAAGGVYCRRCGTKPEIIDQQVWVNAREASVIVGKPIETVRTWFKRGRVGWGPPIAPNLGWLPIIVRRAQLATVPPSGNLNHGSGAELSTGSGYGDLKSSPSSCSDDGQRSSPAWTRAQSLSESEAPVPTNVPPDGTTPTTADPADHRTAGSDS